MDKEDCPMGEDCGIHFRVDESYSDPEWEDGRFISYRGDFCVVTDSNPAFIPDGEIRALLEKAHELLGEVVPEGHDGRYETCVFKVGEGALDDIPEEDVLNPRWRLAHDDWKNLADAHDMIVNGVETQLIAL